LPWRCGARLRGVRKFPLGETRQLQQLEKVCVTRFDRFALRILPLLLRDRTKQLSGRTLLGSA
jgi:hypothetical protein